MAITLNSPAMTRRGVLAGIGGMTFSFAFGTDGTQLLPPAARSKCHRGYASRLTAGSPSLL